MKLRLTFALALFAAAFAAPAAAQDRILASARPPATACPAGGPLQVWLLQQSSATDCDNTVSGTTDALCCCINNSWGACASAGAGGNSFQTIDLPSGTDPVADSSADTLTVTCSGPLTCTGNSGADSWALAWSGTFADAQVDGSLEADELVLAGDVDGTANANDLDEAAVESELEGVLDLQDLQGAVTDAQVPNTITIDNATTATALASNPGDCSLSDGTEAAYAIAASGNLSCAAIPFTSRTLDRKASATTINNTVTETAVYSYTIPASTLDANGEIVLTLWSEFLNNTGFGRGYIIKVKLGGTTVIEFDMGSSALVSTATRRLSQTVVSLAARGATNSQIVTMRHEISSRTGLSGTLTTGVGTTMSTAVQMLTVNSGTLSQDMTTSKVLEVSITLSTNSTSLEWLTYAGTLELLNP